MKAEVKISVGRKHPYQILDLPFEYWLLDSYRGKLAGKFFPDKNKAEVVRPDGTKFFVPMKLKDIEEVAEDIYNYKVMKGWEEPML